MAELTINDRLKHVLQINKVAISELVNGIENDRTRLSRQLNGVAAISIDTISLFLNKFPDVSAEWLLRGEGTMEKSGHFAPNIYNNGSIGSLGNNKGTQTVSSHSDAVLQAQIDSMNTVLSMKDELLALKDRQINDLTLDKHALQNQLNQLLIKLPKIR